MKVYSRGSKIILASGSNINIKGGYCKVPNGINIIGKQAFSFDNEIREIIIPEETELIEYGAFLNCKNLRYAEFPGVEEVKERAFEGCKNLNRIYMPKIKFIQDYAFKDTDFGEIWLETTTYVSETAFEGSTTKIVWMEEGRPILGASKITYKERNKIIGKIVELEQKLKRVGEE